MRVVFSIIFLSFSLGVISQTIRVKFAASPADRAKLTYDGEDMGLANGQKIVMGFNERKGIVEHTAVISCNGYVEQTFTFNEGESKNETIRCDLERYLPKLEDPPNLVVEVEKIVSGIEYSTDVGANTRWKYRYDEEINLSMKQSKMHRAIADVGLSTLQSHSDDLFNVGTSKPKIADILIAGRVEEFGLKRNSGSGYSGSYTSDIVINWQVYDRHNQEIILKRDVESEYTFQSHLISEQFYNGVLDNFYIFLGEDKAFIEAIQGIDADQIAEIIESDSLTAEEEASDKVSIQRVRLEEVEDFSDLIEMAMKSSVTVLIDQNQGHGSGVVVSSNGYIVTNEHVTNGAKLIDIQFSNGMTLPADLISSSEKHDLSLLKVRASGLTALPIISNSDLAREGEEVYVIGAPGDTELSQSVSKGIISAKRNIDGVKFIQTDTKISPGSSGSPLINNEGEIIGIINMKLVGDGVEGLSFAIDARYLNSVLGLTYE
ncbi:MAG: trypsin-like peptidase domain-containing protein [Flavobacteriales bacterium]|nr:trypsin-like peptidase domain-containing protein [Flavobacteriales bacterium]